jgi:hypothetical protein
VYRQALMHRSDGSGYVVLRAWIAADLAKVGKVLRLKIDDEWEDGWKVIEAGEARDEETVKGYEAQGRRGYASVSGRDA